MIEVGDTISWSADVYDKDPADGGVLTNASAVTFTLTLPDRTTSTPTVVNPPAQTGLYRYQYPTVQVGLHTGRWSFTMPGGNTVTHGQEYYTEPAGPGGLVSLPEVKAHLGITTATADDELRSWIGAATEMVEAEVGPVLVRTRTDVVTGYEELWLPVSPVMSVASVVPQRGGVPLVVGELTAEPSGRLYRTSGAVMGYMSPWIVTYTVGRTIIPRAITRAALVIIGHLWELQRGPVDMVLAGEQEAAPVGMGFAIPNRARELLAPWRRLPSLA